MEVTCSGEGSPPSLTSVPPELLLRIVSFLPGPSAFLAVAQTSAGLRQFFCRHASSICNQYILSHFLSSAILFDSRLQDGWLVPSESGVWREESLLLERKRRYCAACRGQAQPVLQPRRDAVVFRSDDSEYCPSPCAGRYCSNRDNTDLRFPLSSPGPLYLAFLEEYRWDIDIFAESLNFQGPAHGNDAYLSEHDRINERYRKKPDVIWKISTYAVRPFLQKLDAIILNDCGCGTDSNPSLSSAPTPPIEAKNSLAHMMLAKSGLRKIFPFIGSKNKQVKRRLYGEIPQGPDKTKLRTGTKCGLGKEARSAVLLWTIVSGRVEGLASSSPISTSPTSTTVGAPLLEREGPKSINLMKGITNKTKAIGKSLSLGLAASSSRVLSYVRRVWLGKKRGFAILK